MAEGDLAVVGVRLRGLARMTVTGWKQRLLPNTAAVSDIPFLIVLATVCN